MTMTHRFEGRAVLFCATQRSGSSMISDDFQNVVGRKRTESEAFYNFGLSPKAAPGQTWPELMEKMYDLRRDDIAFFDKVMYHYLPQLSAMIAPETPDPLCSHFAQYFQGAIWVHIRRANIFEQTISKYFAETLHVWDAADRKSAEFNLTAEFDLERARAILQDFLAEDREWQRFFAHHGIKPLEVFYEDAVTNFPAYLTPLMDRLGTPIPQDRAIHRRMAKLGNERNSILADVLRNMLLRDTISRDLATRQFYRQLD